MINLGESDLPQLAVESLLKRYKGEKRRKKWEPIYRMLLVEAERLSTPAAINDEFSVAAVPELSRWLPADSVSVVLALCTLGPQVEDYIKELSRDNLVYAVVLNEIVLALITAFSRQIHASIRYQAQTRGLKAGAAYRPGVGRWPLETQQSIFARLPTHKIGVTLSEQLWMIPTKSTSLIIPLLDRRQSQSKQATAEKGGNV